jgi:hypothetical protein
LNDLAGGLTLRRRSCFFLNELVGKRTTGETCFIVFIGLFLSVVAAELRVRYDGNCKHYIPCCLNKDAGRGLPGFVSFLLNFQIPFGQA